MKNIKHIVLIIMFVILTGITLVFSYWSLEGTFFHKIFAQDRIIMQTTKTVYHVNETVQATFSFCKNIKADPIIQWSLIDTYLRTYPPRSVYSPYKGCVTNKVTNIEVIAPTLPVDTYYFSGTATYHLNPIKTVVVPLITNHFEVQ